MTSCFVVALVCSVGVFSGQSPACMSVSSTIPQDVSCQMSVYTVQSFASIGVGIYKRPSRATRQHPNRYLIVLIDEHIPISSEK